MFNIDVSVLVAKNFVHSSTAADLGHHSFGELVPFIYCSACCKKIRKASSLPLLEQREEYVTPNHSKFPVIDEKDCLLALSWWLFWTKLGANICRLSFAEIPVAFSRNLWIVCSWPLLWDRSLYRVWAASVLQLCLVEMTSLLSSCWSLQGWKPSFLCRGWSGHRRGAALT